MGSGRFRYRIQPDQLPEPMGSGTGAETMSMATRSYSVSIATLCPIIIPVFMKPNGKQTLVKLINHLLLMLKSRFTSEENFSPSRKDLSIGS